MKTCKALLLLTLISSVCSAQEPKTIIESPAMPENPPETADLSLAHEPELALDPNPAFF